MSRIALLIAETEALQDGNALRFANGLLSRHHDVWLCPTDSLSMHKSTIAARGHRLLTPARTGDPMPAFSPTSLEDMDTIWLLSLGMRHSFLDKMQLLYSLSRRARIINSLDAVFHLKSKYLLASQAACFDHPPTWASTDPGELYRVLQQEGGKFIAKPPAASFGRDVYVLAADTPNVHVILESLCGPDKDHYCLLQRYVEEIAHGEKRVLIAGGEPVGQYLRRAHKDHRTNVEQGAMTSACELTNIEADYCRKIGRFLLEMGAVFVGMDLAWPWVIEFNVINPGGITTIETLTGKDISNKVLDRLFPDAESA